MEKPRAVRVLLALDLGHVFGADLADSGDLAVLDPPQAERAGDVAVLVEADRADHTLVLDRLAFLDEGQRLGELLLARMDRGRTFGSDFADRILDRRRLALARLGDGECDDGAGIIGAVGSRRVGLDAARELLEALVELFG